MKPQHHAKPQQTLAQIETRLVMELASCTDAAFAGKSVDSLHAGSYSRLRRGVIERVYADAASSRGLSAVDGFARVLEEGL